MKYCRGHSGKCLSLVLCGLGEMMNLSEPWFPHLCGDGSKVSPWTPDSPLGKALVVSVGHNSSLGSPVILMVMMMFWNSDLEGRRNLTAPPGQCVSSFCVRQ